MNLPILHKITPYFRTAIYLIAFVVCFFTAYSLSKMSNPEQNKNKLFFRVMTYNIHHGEGMDGKMDLKKIAGIIKEENADVVLLQEVDINVKRSGNRNIPKELAEMAGLRNIAFGKNLDLGSGEYGNATLSKFPVLYSENIHFEKTGPEQRGILVTEISIHEVNVLVLNTHLDHRTEDSEKLMYVERTLQEILPGYGTHAVLFGGDFNDIPGSKMYRQLTRKLTDTWSVSGKGKGLTFPANKPDKRIDYIFYNGNISSTAAWIPETEASDHRPVVVEFVLSGKDVKQKN